MKKKILLISLILMSILIVGCAKKEKEFKKSDFKITLTEDYKEDSVKEATYYFASSNTGVTVLKETFELLSIIDITSESSLEDYGKAVLKANNRNNELIKENDFIYFTYDNSINSNKFYYVSVMKKGKDAFWLINFFCLYEDKDKYEQEFLRFARTIEV